MKKNVVVIVICGLLLAWTMESGRLILTNNVRINPTAWDDIRVPLTRARILGQASDADFDVFIGSTRAMTFDDTLDEEIFFSLQIPHNYRYGTNLHPHIYEIDDFGSRQELIK